MPNRRSLLIFQSLVIEIAHTHKGLLITTFEENELINPPPQKKNPNTT